MTASRQRKVLRIAFMAGAITDALAVIPMLSPRIARLAWGFENFDSNYFFAMGYGSALMVGWTMLLLWAYRKPVERSFVALLTIVVIIGFVITEVILATTGRIEPTKMIPSWIMQTILTGLFSFGYWGKE